ncbi:LamD-like protein [Mycobacterium phage Marcoliusprime]|nr:LamD-like protein [Mycobacterium phage Marcoliusprime]ASR86579.1 LamD-like protein [Mycobacterium phage DismalFunk]AYB68990.1 LamD-like protein [Mycobacterium phage DismalStressor]
MHITDLILARKNDRSYRQLEAASGGIVKAQRWNQIANGLRVVEFPEPRTIEAIAQALDVPVSTVLLSFGEALGLAVDSPSSFAALIPPSADKLTPDQQHAVLAVIRSYAAA